VILTGLATGALQTTDLSTDATTCAVIVLAGSVLDEPDTEIDANLRQLLTVASLAVQAAVIDQLDEKEGEEGPTRSLDPHGKALVAAAFARLALQTRQPEQRAVVREAIDRAWDSVPAHRRVALLPWIGWAESDYATLGGFDPARAEDLMELQTVLDAVRISPLASADRSDLAGGFAFSVARGSRPDAQTTRPAAWLASAIRDPALIDPEAAPAALGRHLKTMRFLVQLAVDDSMLWAIRNPSRAVGGLRKAPWDSDQPVAAQAMALLTAAETLITLDELAGRAENRPADE
jgi:hypothetical protein